MQQFRFDTNTLGAGYPVIGNSSEQFNIADPLTIDTDGFLKVATAGEKIVGFSQDIRLMATDNETVAKIKPQYFLTIGAFLQYTADQAVTQTDIGAYADIGTATSGAIVLNFAAGATGQFFCVGFDPDGDGSTTEAVVQVAEPQYLAFAQS